VSCLVFCFVAALTRRFSVVGQANNYSAFWRVHLRASPQVTEASQAFLNRLLVTNTEYRMTADEVLEDDWLAGDVYHPDELCARMSERYQSI
jgi:hypothetical protein